MDATKDLNLSASVFQNNFSKFYKSRDIADCRYVNFHRGGTLGVRTLMPLVSKKAFFKSLLTVLHLVVLRKTL